MNNSDEWSTLLWKNMYMEGGFSKFTDCKVLFIGNLDLIIAQVLNSRLFEITKESDRWSDDVLEKEREKISEASHVVNQAFHRHIDLPISAYTNNKDIEFLATVETAKHAVSGYIIDWLYKNPDVCKYLGFSIFTPFKIKEFFCGALAFDNGVIVLDYQKGNYLLSTLSTFLKLRSGIFATQHKPCEPLSIYMAGKVGAIDTSLETGDVVIPNSVVDLPSRFRQDEFYKSEYSFSNCLANTNLDFPSVISPKIIQDIKFGHPIVDVLLMVSMQDVEFMKSKGASAFDMELYYLAALSEASLSNQYNFPCKLKLGFAGWVGMTPDSMKRGLSIDDDYPLSPLAAHALILKAIQKQENLFL